MAIRIIEGVPGSGKTYYAVRHVYNEYYTFFEGEYELVKPVTIITNIDSFKPAHLSLQSLIKDAGGIKDFFSEYYQKAITECIGGQIVYIIDEAQKLFRKGARDMGDVWSYFEYHRHFGHDIYLVTQNSRKLPTDLTTLCEYRIVASPRSRSVVGEFRYRWLSGTDVLKREGFRPDPKVFGLYSSMELSESEKIRNPVMRTVVMVFGGVAVVVVGLGYYFYSGWVRPYKTAGSPLPVQEESVVTVPDFAAHDDGATVPVSVSVIDEAVANRHGRLITTRWVVLGSRVYSSTVYPYGVRRALGDWVSDIPAELAAELEARRQRARDERNDSDSGTADRPAPVRRDDRIEIVRSRGDV